MAIKQPEIIWILYLYIVFIYKRGRHRSIINAATCWHRKGRLNTLLVHATSTYREKYFIFRFIVVEFYIFQPKPYME